MSWLETYYEILGVDAHAGPEEIRRAYRRAVRTAHPDTGGSAERFHDVLDAWRVLSDPTRRAGYDARTGPPPPPAPPQPRSRGDTAPPPPPTAPPAPSSPPPQPAPSMSSDRTSSPAEPAGSTDTSASESPEPRRWMRPRPLVVLAVTLAASSGALTVLILTSVGRVLGVIAAGYLAATAAALVHRLRHGAPAAPAGEPSGGARGYQLLLRGAWVLAGAFAALALLSWALGETPIPPALWGACVATFALSVAWTARLARADEPGQT